MGDLGCRRYAFLGQEENLAVVAESHATGRLRFLTAIGRQTSLRRYGNGAVAVGQTGVDPVSFKLFQNTPLSSWGMSPLACRIGGDLEPVSAELHAAPASRALLARVIKMQHAMSAFSDTMGVNVRE